MSLTKLSFDILPTFKLGFEPVCENELCETEGSKTIYCRNCDKFFCQQHKEHQCIEPEIVKAPTGSNLIACKVCKRDIEPKDFDARRIKVRLKNGTDFEFSRCGRCETQIQAIRTGKKNAVVVVKKQRKKTNALLNSVGEE